MKKRSLSFLLAVLIVVMLLPTAALAVNENIPGTANVYNGHSYVRLDEGMTWTEAKAYCEALGGYLACITSEGEQRFVESLLKDGAKTFYWIGATDKDEEGVWKWVSGEAFSYTHWGSRQPDNNHHGVEESYLGIARQNESWAASGHWNDFTDDGSDPGLGGLICEWGQANVGPKVNVYNGHTYQRIDDGMTWTEARAYCEALDGHLVCITSEGEQAFVEALLEDGTRSFYWIGATDEAREGVWKWVSGEAFSYKHWASRQPDNYYQGAEENYAGLPRRNENWAGFGQWNDFTNRGSAAGLGGLICEWDGIRTSFGSAVSGWSLPEMEKALELGLVPDVLIGQDLTRKIDRAEFAAVAVKTYEALTGVKVVPAVEDPFTDCKDLEVLKAYAIGAVAGTSATTFSPHALLDREEAATMLTRVFKRTTLPNWTLATDGQFTLNYTMPARFADDKDISGWAKDSVYFMAANGIISGISGDRFAPKNVTSAQEAQGYANATREQALAIAVRMVEKL